MIDYEPRAWVRHLFTVRGSIIPAVAWRLGLVTAFTVAVVILHGRYDWYDPPPTPHQIMGLALGLILVFRNNSAYDRWWEGRKRWGGMVNRTRDLTRQILTWIDGLPELKERLVRHVVAYVYLVKQHLRSDRGLRDLDHLLDRAAIDAIAQSTHRPLFAAEVLALGLREARARDALHPYAAMHLDANVTYLVDEMGACERIVRTPMPFAYVTHTRQFLALYVLTLPLALVGIFGWATVPITALVTYGFLGVDEIAVQIEDPFGHDPNDLPLEAICQGIERSCLELLDRGRAADASEAAS